MLENPYFAILVTVLFCASIVIFVAVFKSLLLPLLLYISNVVAGIASKRNILPISFFFVTKQVNPAKGDPFECGIEATTHIPQRLNIKYYIVGVIFILFDVTLAFVYAWATTLQSNGWTGFYTMLCFLGLVEFALLYIWKRGVLDWLN